MPTQERPATLGRFMPSRRPSEDAPDRFILKTDSIGTAYAALNTLTPKRVKAILTMAEEQGDLAELYLLYDRMETTDTRWGGLVNQLGSAVAGMPLKIVTAEGTSDGERQVAEDYAAVMKEVLHRLDAHSVVKGMCAPYTVGAKLFQVRWEMQDLPYGRRMWMPVEMRPVDGRFLFMDRRPRSDTYGELMVKSARAPMGEPVSGLPRGSAILLETEFAHNRYDRIGVARKVLPWYLGCQFIGPWWIQYIEGYGAPIRIGRHPRGIKGDDRANMERFLRMLGQAGYALFPNDLEVQLIEANRQGTVTTYADFMRKAHEEYAVALLGQAETVGDKGKGSYANYVVANSIRYEVLKELAALVHKGLHALTDQVLSINYGEAYDPRLAPHIEPVVITPQEMTAKATTLQTLTQMGVAVPLEYPYEQILGIAQPRTGQRAILNGRVYVYGVDPEPQPMQTNANGDPGQPRPDQQGGRSVVEGE